MVWLGGGPSTIDMWDLKPNARKEIRGEFRPIDTAADGIQICEHLPLVAKQMEQCSLIRSVSHTIAEHGQGTEYVTTGNPIGPALSYPSIGSIVSSQHSATKGVPTYMDLAALDLGKAGFLGSTHNPFVVSSFGESNGRRPGRGLSSPFELPEGLTVEDLNRRSQLLQKMEAGFRQFDQTARAQEMTQFQQQAVDILSTGKTREALDLSKESAATRRRYGFGRFADSALAARRLIQAGVRFVTIGLTGWDTHADNFNQLRQQLLPRLDSSLSALLEDLQETGLLDETIVYCVGEFNRTPMINALGGRDHWARSMSVLVAGGGFKKGFVFGATDENGMEPADRPCSPTDVNATILNQVGIAPETILKTNSGRPVQAFRGATLLTDLVNS